MRHKALLSLFLGGSLISVSTGLWFIWSRPPERHDTATAGTTITNTIGMKLVYIESGEFTMGSPTSEKERSKNEFQHPVAITTGFYMGVYPVTQDEYEKVMEKKPSYFSSEGVGKSQVASLDTRQFPVETVSWEDAKEFCRMLSAAEGKKYRLPTDAEWEYACRAETTTPFHFGETISTDQVNFNGDFVLGAYGAGKKGEYRSRTTKVGTFTANAFGLHDMHGNVWQWCEDWYDAKFYENSPATDPRNEAPGTHRCMRGGSWAHPPGVARSAYRGFNAPDNRFNYIGFRVVCGGIP